MSCPSVSRNVPPMASWISSRVRSSPPSSMRARRSASARTSPERPRGWARSGTWRARPGGRSAGPRRAAGPRRSHFTRLRGEHAVDGGGEAVPARGLLAEPRAARRRELVELGAPIVVRRAPRALEEPLPHEPEERRVEGTLLHEQRAARDLAY